MSEVKFTARQVHCGQYRKYDDFYRKWEIETSEGREATLEYCFTELHKWRVPESAEYHAKIRQGGEEYDNEGYYFAGYYTLAEIKGGYLFTVCEPYCD